MSCSCLQGAPSVMHLLARTGSTPRRSAFSAPRPSPPADVVVIGAGSRSDGGVSAQARGRRVVVLERGRCALIDTAHTTAHLTRHRSALTAREELRRRSRPRRVGRGRRGDRADRHLVHDESIDCGFSGCRYLHRPVARFRPGRRALQKGASLARELVSTPTSCRACRSSTPGVESRARFHPRRHLAADRGDQSRRQPSSSTAPSTK